MNNRIDILCEEKFITEEYRKAIKYYDTYLHKFSRYLRNPSEHTKRMYPAIKHKDKKGIIALHALLAMVDEDQPPTQKANKKTPLKSQTEKKR